VRITEPTIAGGCLAFNSRLTSLRTPSGWPYRELNPIGTKAADRAMLRLMGETNASRISKIS